MYLFPIPNSNEPNAPQILPSKLKSLAWFHCLEKEGKKAIGSSSSIHQSHLKWSVLADLKKNLQLHSTTENSHMNPARHYLIKNLILKI